MTELSRRLRFHAVAVGGQWFARAEDAATGERWGIECAGSTEAVAIDRLRRWVDWQREHVEALEALQQAERAYHRVLAGDAFTDAGDGAAGRADRLAALEAVGRLRARLDAVRARRPE